MIKLDHVTKRYGTKTAVQDLSLEIAATSLFSMEASTFGPELREMVSKYMDTVGRLYPTDVLLPDGVPTVVRARRALFRRRWIRLIRSIIEVRGDAVHVDAPRDLFDLLREAHGSDREELLADEVSTMIVAGHETTALTLLRTFTIAMTSDRPVLPVGTLSTRPDHAPTFVLQARLRN